MRSSLAGTFLVIDDDDGLRGLLEALIAGAGGEALCAADEREALALLQQNPGSITAALLDMNLDGQKGEEVYDKLMKLAPELPIFPISGMHEDEIRERFGDRKIAGIITKPFRPAQLTQIIAENLPSKS